MSYKYQSIYSGSPSSLTQAASSSLSINTLGSSKFIGLARKGKFIRSPSSVSLKFPCQLPITHDIHGFSRSWTQNHCFACDAKIKGSSLCPFLSRSTRMKLSSFTLTPPLLLTYLHLKIETLKVVQSSNQISSITP